jgi:aminomethyltransferase
MADPAVVQLRTLPVNSLHRSAQARMAACAGCGIPIEYSGLALEYEAVRTRAGFFDVSHMGGIEIAGKDALALVQRMCRNDATRLQVGQAQYSVDRSATPWHGVPCVSIE